MRAWTTMLGMGLAVGTAGADEIKWAASVPLWKNLSPAGKVVDAGPGPFWSNPQSAIEPAARIGPVLPEVRSAPEGTPRPRELPEELTDQVRPTILPFPRVVGVDQPVPQPYGRNELVPLVPPSTDDGPIIRSVFRPVLPTPGAKIIPPLQ